MPKLLHRCGVECYVTGNYGRQEALQLAQHVETLLKVVLNLNSHPDLDPNLHKCSAYACHDLQLAKHVETLLKVVLCKYMP